MKYTTAQISRAGVRYVYVLDATGKVVHLEQAYDCGHGGSIIAGRLEKAGYPYRRASQAQWADKVRRSFLAQHDQQSIS